jgi:WD40 repeat protein
MAARTTEAAYDAFISYSHRTGGQLGPALRDALHDFGRPWYRLRTMRVFCDRSSISPNESLWAAIEAALRSSATFILLASNESARSHWVQRELLTWQAQTPRRPVLIVLTDGDIVWNRSTGDFDWERTTALPPSLRGWFDDEPLWVDLRPVVALASAQSRAYSTADPLFLDAVATIAAAVQHRPKDELIGDDIRKYRGARRFRRLSWSGLSLLTVAALLAAVTAGIQRGEAQAQTRVALGEKLVAQADLARTDRPRDSLEFGLAAAATDATPAARTAVQQTLAQSYYAGSITDHDSGVSGVVYTPDGHTIVSSDVEGRVIFSNADRRTEIGELPKQDYQIGRIALDSTGRLLATTAVGDKGSAIWDIADVRHPRQLATLPLTTSYPDTYYPIEIAFRPHSTELVVADGLFSVSLWSLAAPTQPIRLATIDGGVPGSADAGTSDTGDLAFTPDGSTLILGGESDTATFWNIDQVPPKYVGNVSYPGDWSSVTAVGVDPGQRILAVATGTTIGVFDVSDLAHPRLTTRLAAVAQVLAVAVGPDGRSVVAGGADDAVTLWDVGNPAAPVQVTSLRGHTDTINALTFSPDGRQIATASNDFTVMLWHRYSISDPAPVTTFTLGRSPSNAAVFRPDGRVLAVGGGDNTVTLWATDDLTRPRLLSQVASWLLKDTLAATLLRANVHGVQDLVFSPDGRLLAFGGSGTPSGSDGVVNLFDVTDPTTPRHLTTLGDYQNVVDRVAFSADGALLATGGATPVSGSSAFITLWSLADPAHPLQGSRFDVPLKVINELRFDAHLLYATGYSNGAPQTTTSWDVTDPSRPVPKAAFGTEKDASTTAVALGQHWLVTGGVDKDLTVWDTTDPGRPASLATMDGHRGGVSTASLDAAGSLLATSGQDKTVRVWDASTPRGPTQLAAIPWVGDQPVSALFDPAQPLLLLLDRAGTARLWNTADLDGVVRDPVAVACAALTPGPAAAEWGGKLDPKFSGATC